jgi:hypothetical protein
LAKELRASDWLAGIVNKEIHSDQIRHILTTRQPMLAIVDDVNERATRVDAPARLLLLGRSDGDWLNGLGTSADGEAAKLFGDITRSTTMRLDPATAQPAAQYRAARTAFAATLGRDPGTAGWTEFEPPASVLGIHAAALVAVLGTTTTSGDEFCAVVEHDRRYLRQLVRDHAGLDETVLETVSTFSTLCRPASAHKAAALRPAMVDSLGLDDALVKACGTALQLAFPGRFEFNAVRPDPLGEHLVAQTLSTNPAIVIALDATCTDEQIMTVFTVLGRAMRNHPDLSEEVVRFVRVKPERLVPIAVVAATRLEEPEPFVRALAAAIRDGSLSINGVWALLHQLSTAGPSLNLLKTAAHKAFTTGFAPPLIAESTAGAHLSHLTQMSIDGTAALVNPKSGLLPAKSDDTPLVPLHLLDQLRRIWVDGNFFSDDGDNIPDDGGDKWLHAAYEDLVLGVRDEIDTDDAFQRMLELTRRAEDRPDSAVETDESSLSGPEPERESGGSKLD